MKKIVLIGLAFSYFVSLSVLANEQPRSMATDSRIKIVAYNSDDVVTVHGSHLVATSIQFDSDETIVSIVNGDPVAWTTAVNKSIPYLLTIKPILPSSDTNMTVITNKHNYQFHLMTSPGDTADSKSVTYLLRFKYPAEEKAQLQTELNSFVKTFTGDSPVNLVNLNNDYSFYGAKTIAPIQAVDNGQFTLFKFAKNTPIPAVFSVDDHGNESIVNFSTQGDAIYIQGVHRLYTFRNGDDVTSVYNDHFKMR